MGKKILLIDDSPTQLISLKTSFSKFSYEIITAKDGAEGIFKAYEVLPDLIIADIIMPEINGYQLCRLLKNDDLTKDIIELSKYIYEYYIERMRKEEEKKSGKKY